MASITPNLFSRVGRCRQLVANLITIRFFAAAKAITKVPQIQVSANTLGQALDLATEEFPNLVQALPKCSYLLNGQTTKNNSAQLNSGDTIDVLPPFAGG